MNMACTPVKRKKFAKKRRQREDRDRPLYRDSSMPQEAVFPAGPSPRGFSREPQNTPVKRQETSFIVKQCVS